jgi:hypothetical protein
MKVNRTRELGIWIGLLIVNVALLSLSRHVHPGFHAFGAGWTLVNLLVGVVVFPAVASVLLILCFRAQAVRQWTSATMLIFVSGVVLFACHLFLATLWMVHRTHVLPEGLARGAHTLLGYGYSVFAPALAAGVVLLWFRQRSTANGLSQKV